MSLTLTPFDLKELLEQLRTPERLDDHPWTHSRLVAAQLAADPSLSTASPGLQLARAVSQVFRELRPSAPPRRGKRLDTRWGEFGLLAAQYFAPFEFGTPAPLSLREAWGKIDPAILQFVTASGQAADPARYQLLGGELEVAPISTLSDWHRKGLERLVGVLLEREEHLLRQEAAHEPPAPVKLAPRPRSRAWRWLGWVLATLLLLAGLWVVGWGWSLAQQAQRLLQELDQLKTLAAGDLGPETLQKAAPLLESLETDLAELRQQTALPLAWFGPRLAWVPVYGADLASAADLLELAETSVQAANLSVQGAAPFVEALQASAEPLTPRSVTELLLTAQPQFRQAAEKLTAAQTIQARLKTVQFSPKVQARFDQLGPLLLTMEDGLNLALALPKALGAGTAGPQTYLLLVQNEDELRATGGYLSAVGSFVVRDGELFGLEFENTDFLEDWSKPYPVAPWQMENYMNIPVILFRDANWSPDYLSSVSLAEYLYAYARGHSADGVLALNQQALVMLLEALGPVKLAGVPEPIGAANLVQYMREAKRPPELNRPTDWDRKDFIGKLAKAILDKVLSGQVKWEPLTRALLTALNQRQVLLQFDDPTLAGLAARHNWDGAVRAGQADFLFSVDTNFGYNKTNALVEKSLSYSVDLSNLDEPQAELVVFEQNRSRSEPVCIQWAGAGPDDPELWYLVNRCYYNYLRVYLPEGTRLLSAQPQAIPADWMMLGQAVPARVDQLEPEVENVAGVQGFGTLMVVPGQKTQGVSFNFALPPARVLQPGPAAGQWTYQLKIQKQAGTRALPLSLRIHLPSSARLVSVSPASAQWLDQTLLLETTLKTDLLVTVIFTNP
jgi:hypothetical protein